MVYIFDLMYILINIKRCFISFKFVKGYERYVKCEIKFKSRYIVIIKLLLNLFIIFVFFYIGVCECCYYLFLCLNFLIIVCVLLIIILF